MRYAISMKADIINYSGGGTVANPEELRLLREASRLGILVVAAAGNESTSSEKHPFYPANYNLPNIISVTAIDDIKGKVEMLPTSNYGIHSVAVAAQGKDVMSTLPGGRYGQMTGTSQATAFVTGAAVKLLEEGFARKLKTSPEELIERLVSSSSSNEVLKGKTRIGSQLSVSRAMRFRNVASETTSAPNRKMRRELVEALEAEIGGTVNASLRP
jgi:subtilisin family serine protease